MTATLTSRFPRREKGGVLLGLRLVQIALLLLAVLLTALGTLGSPPAWIRPLALLLAALLGVAAIARVESMPAYRWLLLKSAHVVRRQTTQNSYRARPLKPTSKGTLRLQGTVASLRLIQYGRVLGVVHDPRLRRVTAVARIAGPAHLLQNTDEQDRRVAEYGRMIAGLCQAGRVARAQVVERTLPDSGDGLMAWARQRDLDGQTAAGEIYRDLLDQAAPASARHETLVSFSLDLTAISRDVRRMGGGLAGATAVLESEARGLQASLTAAGVNGRWLSSGEIAAAVRAAFDPRAMRTIDRLGGELPSSSAGPLGIDVEWDYLRSDSSYHRVYQIEEWPRVRTSAAFLSPLLLKPGVRRTFSLVLQPIPAAKAMRDARRHQVERVTDRATRKRIGQLETEENRQVDADVSQRERDLAAGHGDVRWVGLVAVSADTRDGLDDACGQIELAAAQAFLDLRVLVGQQAEGLLAAALPFGTGLE